MQALYSIFFAKEFECEHFTTINYGGILYVRQSPTQNRCRAIRIDPRMPIQRYVRLSMVCALLSVISSRSNQTLKEHFIYSVESVVTGSRFLSKNLMGGCCFIKDWIDTDKSDQEFMIFCEKQRKNFFLKIAPVDSLSVKDHFPDKKWISLPNSLPVPFLK